MNAVLALGLIGAGTNNARWATAPPLLPACFSALQRRRYPLRRSSAATPHADRPRAMRAPLLPPACSLAGMLRQLSSYYYKEPTLLFLVRVAQVGGGRGWARTRESACRGTTTDACTGGASPDVEGRLQHRRGLIAGGWHAGRLPRLLP
jgi:hypothetical protein